MGKKSLCGWSKKRIARDMDELCTLVSTPSYVCCNCARAASDKKRLCKPSEIGVTGDVTPKKAPKKATKKKATKKATKKKAE